ncbi:hypothetical protein NSA24_00745 [Clostridioides mangenotii]|uniref:hypothetical protein n=1 Tax=Metaclostridioides mangenotii TaxID=1540 RepID=UPI002149E003|nr:hypothetical protein [Clostridioides mangenotii]MCR1953354.1 hypothetical protein [Clostridioides mangenotii]
MLVLELPKETTIYKQLGKVSEVYSDFVHAVIDDDTNEEILSEFYEVVQEMIGVMYLKGIKVNDIEDGGIMHISKLGDRGWNIKGRVTL